ncbi:hypothetical protein OJ998_00960 [Solirubrobacter taibaiensis]|nr:hypothetical protein [Solirubrobacter taibaiensis]
MLAPLSRQWTYEWFSAFQPGRHRETIERNGHLDVRLREDADPVV